MAKRRMFSLEIVDSDAFLDMSATAQNLYFHLGMRADDDGFIGNPKKICRDCNASQNDLDLLIAKNFILPFANGVVVIKHWKVNNQIQKDRYTPTQYLEEKASLLLKKNGIYTFDENQGKSFILDANPLIASEKASESIEITNNIKQKIKQ